MFHYVKIMWLPPYFDTLFSKLLQLKTLFSVWVTTSPVSNQWDPPSSVTFCLIVPARKQKGPANINRRVGTETDVALWWEDLLSPITSADSDVALQAICLQEWSPCRGWPEAPHRISSVDLRCPLMMYNWTSLAQEALITFLRGL